MNAGICIPEKAISFIVASERYGFKPIQVTKTNCIYRMTDLRYIVENEHKSLIRKVYGLRQAEILSCPVSDPLLIIQGSDLFPYSSISHIY